MALLVGDPTILHPYILDALLNPPYSDVTITGAVDYAKFPQAQW
jgi:hypothetical protein